MSVTVSFETVEGQNVEETGVARGSQPGPLEVKKSRGSSRVASGGVRNITSRVGSGRVGSGLEVFKHHGSYKDARAA